MVDIKLDIKDMVEAPIKINKLNTSNSGRLTEQFSKKSLDHERHQFIINHYGTPSPNYRAVNNMEMKIMESKKTIKKIKIKK